MQDTLITFETAKLAKQKGFDDIRTNHLPYMLEGDDEGCIGASIYCKVYANCCTQSFLQKWLREVHNIEIAVQWFDNCYIKAIAKKPFKANTYRVEGFQSYEECLELALLEALKLI